MQKTDVLVIGSGGAGLIAAIAARQEGSTVTVLSKTKAGLGGCTAYAGGGFTLAAGSVTPAEHRQKTKEIGRGLSRDHLLDIFSGEGETALRELIGLGVTMRIGNGSATVRDSAPTGLMGGAGFTRELAELANQLGVEIVEGAVATKLDIADERVQGVIYVDWITGETNYLQAGAVILATGGAGQIYERTDNPARVTGDGYRLALEAGLPLTDMEFVQFYPLGWAEPGFPSWMIGLPIIDKVRLTDQDGKEFLHEALEQMGLKSGREANLYARDMSARLVAEKIWKGGQVQLHFEELSEQDWQHRSLRDERRFYPADKDPRTYGPVKVAPIQHYMCGGVLIDEDGRTGIPGLFAGGEVTGGVDGASRIGGNALTNLSVFGLRAGRAAAQQALDQRGGQLNRAFEQVVFVQEGEEPGVLRQEIRSIATAALGPVRNASSLASAISSLDAIHFRLSRVRATSPKERLLALELPGLWMSARAVAQAALAREESRGVHYRSDFPSEQAHWQRSAQVAWENGQVISKL